MNFDGRYSSGQILSGILVKVSITLVNLRSDVSTKMREGSLLTSVELWSRTVAFPKALGTTVGMKMY
jgi:hypothetical protein